MKYIFAITAVCLAFANFAMSTSLNYTDLPQENYNEVTVDISVSSLSHLFVMTRDFVNIVFLPFSSLESFLYSLVTGGVNGSSDFLNDLLNQWQALAALEVGYLACLAAGLLFIILVPLVSFIMCCCRTCCDNCGGEMIQTRKRTRSKWRHCFCVSLLIITVFIAVPCVFVFLTNEWINDVVKLFPEKTSASLDDVIKYIDSIPNQLNHITDQYGRLDQSLRTDVSDIGNTLGIPIRDEVLQMSNDSLEQFMQLSNDLDGALSALADVQSATTALDTSVAALNSQLSTEKADLDATLTSCPPAFGGCSALQASTSALDSGGDFSALGDVQTEIDNINSTLNAADTDAQISTVLQEINDIPQTVTNNTVDVVDGVLDTLTEINSTLTSSLGELPLASVQDFKSQISSVNDSIVQATTTYAENYDIYRYIAGVVLGSVFAVICAFYLIGMLMGTCSYKEERIPNLRSCSSNCGGIFIMTAVGLSFIFSWLFMILVTVTFTVGGHGERYACQILEEPYEGLKFTDKILNATGIDISATLQNPDAGLTVDGIFTSCKENESIYNALKLEYVFNITEVIQNSTAQLSGFQDQLSNVSVDLSSIQVYSPEIQSALNELKAADLASIDFASYLSEISNVVSAAQLSTYAQFLNDTADNVSSISPSFASQLRGHSYNILQIEELYLAPVTADLTRLNTSILMLQDLSQSFNTSIDATEDALIELDAYIQANGSALVTDQATQFSDALIGDVNGFMDWFGIQVTENFGACEPVYLVYTQVVSLLCDYLMDILNGLWFCLGWCVFFLLPGAIVGMKLAKFYRKLDIEDSDGYVNGPWNDMEMAAFNHSNNSNENGRSGSAKFRIFAPERSAKIHPGQYY
ncbi:prominin-1-A-like isoform X3 [Clavelina lepadiformis]|uniref:prominin-1-A-like isoform X3 n=1 Tax=Clavelina lepadiformis TaxID=159417 RepID=UPI00404158A3